MSETLQLLQTNDVYLYTTVTIFGLLVGSFLNVVIYRTPKMMEQDWRAQCAELVAADSTSGTPPASTATEPKITLSAPASTCPHCGHKIRAWENIPVISYLVLGGKCASCKTRISPRYPIIEVVSALLAVVSIAFFGANWTGVAVMVFSWALLVLTMIDIDEQLLPDSITLPLLWLGLIANIPGLFTTLPEAVIGAVAGYLALWSVYHLFRLATGKEGMGYGDFKLLAALGAWMGWKMLPLIILLSSLVGAVIGIGMILLRGRDRNIPIPFGPYLAIAGWIALFWGEPIVNSYLSLYQ